MIAFKNYMRNQEREKQNLEHENYLRNCDATARKQQDAEDGWYRWYKEFDKNQTGKMKDYQERYIDPQVAKRQAEEARIKAGIDAREKAMQDREAQDQAKIKEMKKATYDGNLERLGLRAAQKQA